MIDSIQDLIEELAQEIRCSVAVDDAELRLIGHSTHFEDADAARLSSLVGRVVTGPLLDYVMSQGAQMWRGVTVLPPNPELGIERQRTCIPLRSRYELLGFLWIINANPLTDAQLEAARGAGERIRAVLVHRAQTRIDTEVETESLVQALLAPEPADRYRAARGIAELGLFNELTHFIAVALSVQGASDSDRGELPADLIRQALSYAIKGRKRESFVCAVTETELALLIGYRAVPPIDDAPSLATSIHREICRLDAELSATTVIGVGSTQTEVEAVVVSYDHAIAATRMAVGENVVTWADHPIEAVLSTLLTPSYAAHLIPEPLRSLRDTESEATLTILKTYLEHAGNVNAAAEVLHLHRTTVYYRLNKFQEHTGFDLDDGPTRLLLHLWLRAPQFSRPDQG